MEARFHHWIKKGICEFTFTTFFSLQNSIIYLFIFLISGGNWFSVSLYISLNLANLFFYSVKMSSFYPPHNCEFISCNSEGTCYCEGKQSQIVRLKSCKSGGSGVSIFFQLIVSKTYILVGCCLMKLTLSNSSQLLSHAENIHRLTLR